MNTRVVLTTILFLFALVLIEGCSNPFAPESSNPSASLWEKQNSVGSLLRNFQTSYTFRDSMKYAELLDDDFEFWYYDENIFDYSHWYRESELKATGGMMRSQQSLDLRWGPIALNIDTLSTLDTTVTFTVNFTLSTESYSSISGFARFIVRSDEEGIFRLLHWQDDY